MGSGNETRFRDEPARPHLFDLQISSTVVSSRIYGRMSKVKNRHSIHGIPTSVTERRVGNVGPLIIQAAKQGSKDNLEFLLTLPGGTYIINFVTCSSRYS